MQHEVPSGKSDQCWKDLESDTGFSSYKTFLEDHHADHNFAVTLLEALSGKIHGSPLRSSDWTCSILDLSRTVDQVVEFNQTDFGPSGAAVLEALQRPAKDVCLRLLLWHDPFETMLAGADLVDAFGPILKIDPDFFDALWEDSPNTNDGGHVTLPALGNHVKVGNNAIIMGSYKPRAEHDLVPFVLIAGKLGRTNWWSAKDKSCSKESYRVTGNRPPIGNTQRLQRPVDNRTQPWLSLRIDSLRRLYAKDDIISPDYEALSFASIIPLLQQDMERMRLKCRQLNSFLTADEVTADLDRLHSERFWLRHWIEDAESTSENVVAYIQSQCKPDWLRNPSWLRIENVSQKMRAQARRLEAEIQEFLQLHSGRDTLEELRKSIDLSNTQIEEGKRVKIFTILAFIYIPLNLATSIFGMNLQQLNQSGQQIWVFIITAAISLIITALSWFLVEQSNSYLTWLRRENTEWQGRPHYSIAVRIALLLWLLRNGHAVWARSSGAWWPILTNNGSLCRFIAYDPDDNGPINRMGAGAYVSRYRHMPASIASVAFQEGLVTWQQPIRWRPKSRETKFIGAAKFDQSASTEICDNA